MFIVKETIVSNIFKWFPQQLKTREAALNEAGDLQQFLRDLDEFQAWLSKTMTAVASEDIPESLKEAEKLLNKHAAIKDEIDGYEENYGKMKEQGDRITEGQTDTQYMFLKQVSYKDQPVSTYYLV